MPSGTCDICGEELSKTRCDKCVKERGALEHARQTLESVSHRDTHFRGVPLEKFSYDELRKIIALCVEGNRYK